MKITQTAFISILIITTLVYQNTAFSKKLKIDSNVELQKKLGESDRLIFFSDWEYQKTVDPKTGLLPENIRTKEFNYSRTLPSKLSFERNPSDNTIQTQNWFSRGPENVSGRMISITPDLDNELIMNAGSASGGAWKTIDGGKNWAKSTSPDQSYPVSCFAQDLRKGKKNIWYFGTGELLSTTDRRVGLNVRTLLNGNGIFKSTDYGSSWNQINTTNSSYNGHISSQFQGIWNIVTDSSRQDSDIVLASCYGGILRSSDGGDNWVQVLGDSINKPFSTYIIRAFDGTFYAAISSYSSTGNVSLNAGIWKSKNGIEWTKVSDNDLPASRVIKMALAPSNNNILYIFIESPSVDWNSVSNFQSSNHYFLKATLNPSNNTYVWENRSVNLPYSNGQYPLTMIGLNTLGGYAVTLAVKPDDENFVVFGGTCLYQTNNGLSTAESAKLIGGYYIQNGYSNYQLNSDYLHPDIHCLSFSKSNPSKLIAGSDGGIHFTTNCVDTPVKWVGLNKSLISTQFYSIKMPSALAGDNFLIGGLQDNGSQLSDDKTNINQWTELFGADGMSCVVTPKKEFMIVTYYNGALISGYYDSSIKDYSGTYISPDKYPSGSPIFYTNFALEPNNIDDLYIPSGNHICRKSNVKSSLKDYQLRNQNWSSLQNVVLPDSENITSISISKEPINILYYGTIKGNVYRLDDCNLSNSVPIRITGPDFPFNGFVSNIEIDQTDASNVFVVFSNYNVQSIFHSTDGGATWTKEGGNLEEFPDGSGSGPSIRCLKIARKDSNIIYLAGTSTGLYSTTSLKGKQTQWVRESPDLIGNSIIESIDSRDLDGSIAVATQGNGIFSTTLSVNVKETPVNHIFSINEIYPNPAENYASVLINIPDITDLTIKIYNEIGVLIKEKSEYIINSRNHLINIDIKGIKPAVYFCEFTTRFGKVVRKLVKI